MLKHKILFATAIGVLLSLLFSQIQGFYNSYSAHDGYLLKNGSPVGGDFAIFYIAGKILEETPQKLYDFNFQIEKLHSFISPEGKYKDILVFAYPPFMAKIFSFFSELPLFSAYLTWLILSIALVFASFLLVKEFLPKSRAIRTLTLIAWLAFPPLVIDCLAGGQTSCIGLFIFALIINRFLKGYDFQAGLALGLGIYKPPLFVGIALVFLFARKWRLLAGASLMAAFFIFWSWQLVGTDGLATYVSGISNYSYGANYVNNHKLPTSKGVGYFALVYHGLLKDHLSLARLSLLILTLFTSFTIGRKLEATTRNSTETLIFLSTGMVLSLFFSIQMVKYDLTLLLAPLCILILGSFLKAKSIYIPIISLLVSYLFFGPLLFSESHFSTIPNATCLVMLFIVFFGFLFSYETDYLLANRKKCKSFISY